VTAEAFAGRLASGQQQRGVVVRLPADGVVDLVVAAGLAFVAVDLVDGPFDELSLGRLVSAAHLAGLGVVARIDDSSIAARAVASGVDALDPRHVEVVVTDAPSVSTATAPLTAVDIHRAIATSLTAFADAQPPSPVTVVMLPGMLGDPTLYDGIAAVLEDRFSMHPCRIDLDDSIGEMAASVLAVAPSRFALVGHSLGGIVALEVVRRAPERVTRLALLNSSARSASEHQIQTWTALAERVEQGEFASVAAELAVDNIGPGRDAALVDRWIEMAHRVGPDGFVRQLRAQTGRPDSRPTLPTITVPTLVISGGNDALCPPALQAELAAGLSAAEHRTIDGAGHMSPLDHPAEVAAALADWLAG
jgi:pimeloyl-ACP methyl ester carboxylesterase